MTTAREIMTGGAQCVGENETLVEAARKMRNLDVGVLPICGESQAQRHGLRPGHRGPLPRSGR